MRSKHKLGPIQRGPTMAHKYVLGGVGETSLGTVVWAGMWCGPTDFLFCVCESIRHFSRLLLDLTCRLYSPVYSGSSSACKANPTLTNST